MYYIDYHIYLDWYAIKIVYLDEVYRIVKNIENYCTIKGTVTML